MTEQNTTDGVGGTSAHWLDAWRAFWRRAEWLSVFMGLAFLGSTLVNTLVFDVWGHTFLMIATPTDVLMSGLHLAIAPAFMAVGYASAYTGMASHPSRLRASLLYIIMMALGLITLLLLFEHGPAVAGLWGLSGLVGWFGGGCVVLDDWRARQGVLVRPVTGFQGRLRDAFEKIDRGVTYGMFFAAYLIVAGMMLWFAQKDGYLSHPLRLSLKDTPTDCAGRVLWAGERAMLIDCSNYPARDVQVFYDPEGLRLVRDDRPRPSTPPPPLVVVIEASLRARPFTRKILDAVVDDLKASPAEAPESGPAPARGKASGA